MKNRQSPVKCLDGFNGLSLDQAQEAMEKNSSPAPARDRRQPAPGLETAGDQLSVAAVEDQEVWDRVGVGTACQARAA